MQQHVNLEIMGFVEREILPRYNQFGHSHGMAHVQRVIKNALELVASTGADINMVYVIAAYHDLGMEGPRAIHHLTGGKMLAADMRLRRWFSAEQIRIMKEAVEDHRASAGTREAIDSLAADGCNVIIGTSFGYMQPMAEMAEKYPKIYFAHASGFVHDTSRW